MRYRVVSEPGEQEARPPPPVLADLVADEPFESKPRAIEQADRCPVVGKDPGHEAVDAQGAERHPSEGRDRLRAVAVPTVRAADPVSHLDRAVGLVRVHEADPSDELPVRTSHDQEGQSFAFRPSRAGASEEPARVRPTVLAGHVEGPSLDHRVPHQFDETLHVLRRRDDELEPTSGERQGQAADPARDRSRTSDHRQDRRDRARESAAPKLRYIREGVGCDETFRYFADRFAE